MRAYKLQVYLLLSLTQSLVQTIALVHTDCSPKVDNVTATWVNATSPGVATSPCFFSRSSRYEDPVPNFSPASIAKGARSTVCRAGSLLGRAICPKLNFSSPTRGRIYYNSATQHYSYEPDACVLRRLQFREARSCLAGLGPILFIGDSVTRYQFLTLSHFLASGKYQYPFDGEKSLSNAHTFHALGNAGNHYDKLWSHARNEVVWHSPSGSLYFNHNRAESLEHAHLQLKDGLSGRRLHVYYHYKSYGKRRDIQHAIEWALGKAPNLALVIINVCSHYGVGKQAQIARDVIDSLSWAAKRLGSPDRLVWRSCTTPFDDVRAALDRAEAAIRDHCRASGVHVLDARAVALAGARQGLVTTWEEGTVHFLQFMYEQFNDLLLNVLCSEGTEAGQAGKCQGDA